MLTLKPDKWTIELLKKIQFKIGEIYNEIENLSAEEKQFIQKQALISNIGSSTRIENALLTDIEIEWIDTKLAEDARPSAFDQYKTVILDKFSKDKERSIEEVVGCREVLQIVYEGASYMLPLKESDICGLHKLLLKHYPKASHYAGRYKQHTNRVVMVNHETKESQVVLEPAAPGPITETAMNDLVSWYKETSKEEPWTLLTAVEFTFRFLAIHPFQDGNGRLSRALFLLILLQAEDRHIANITQYLALDRHIEKHRSSYYLALRQGSDGKFYQNSKKYNLEPITLFFLQRYYEALSDIQIYRDKFAKFNSLAENHRLVLECFKANPEKKLQINEIETQTGINRRTIQTALSKLIDLNLIYKRGAGAGVHYGLSF